MGRHHHFDKRDRELTKQALATNSEDYINDGPGTDYEAVPYSVPNEFFPHYASLG